MNLHSSICERPSSAGRSSQMMQCLRRHLLYSDKRSRDVLFDAIERLIESQAALEGLMLSRLTRDAASAARANSSPVADPVNWDMAAKAVLNSMLRAGVLLAADGRPIANGISAQAERIHALTPGFRETVEAFLLEFLIRDLGDVSTRDHKALAHALFRQFDPSIAIGELEDRVVILLATLRHSVLLREDGFYEVTSSHTDSSQ